MGEHQDGLILLKCLGCKTPTLYRMSHEADRGYTARSYCMACVSDDPLRKLVFRDLQPALVESQRITPVCHETDPREAADE